MHSQIVLNKSYVHKIWSKMVNNCTKGQAITEGSGHVDHLDVVIALCGPLAPHHQTFGPCQGHDVSHTKASRFTGC